MMRSYLLFFLMVILWLPCYGQKDIWLFGYHEYNAPYYGNASLKLDKKFTGQAVVQKDDYLLNFDQTMATWVDTSGQLLLYTNGCAIADAAGNILTEELNPGAEQQILCPEYGYTVEGGALFVDAPGYPNDVLLIHCGIKEDNEAIHIRDKLYLTRLHKEADSYQVSTVNELLIQDRLERFTTVRHGNGRDWWIICPVFLSSKWYIIHLFPGGHSTQIVQLNELPFDKMSCRRGTPNVLVSPSGNQVARWNSSCELRLYDFDRCTGDITPTFNQIPPQADGTKGWTLQHWGVGSLAYSANSRYVYASNHTTIYRLDTQAASPQLDTAFVMHVTWGTPFNQMCLGSDDRIYISQMGSDTFMPYIIFADGINPQLRVKWLSLGNLYRGTMPVYVNRKLGSLDDSICDSLSVAIDAEELLNEEPSVRCYPNPANDYLFIDNLGNYTIHSYSLYNSIGAMVKEVDTFNPKQIPITDLPTGTYMLVFNENHRNSIIMKVVILH
jgi:hypothetical protein